MRCGGQFSCRCLGGHWIDLAAGALAVWTCACAVRDPLGLRGGRGQHCRRGGTNIFRSRLALSLELLLEVGDRPLWLQRLLAGLARLMDPKLGACRLAHVSWCHLGIVRLRPTLACHKCPRIRPHGRRLTPNIGCRRGRVVGRAVDGADCNWAQRELLLRDINQHSSEDIVACGFVLVRILETVPRLLLFAFFSSDLRAPDASW
mmetsp:Transcript_87998/g.284105  ORF Transcript_87998/g.284105 Transcript_87998/m.284105 type:complete len:204 (-) Transcript_87998:1496-2107(-)